MPSRFPVRAGPVDQRLAHRAKLRPFGLRSVERFGKRDVDGVVRRKIVPQIPDARQKKLVRISMQRKVREVGESPRPLARGPVGVVALERMNNL
jgi:hypothetical protein